MINNIKTFMAGATLASVSIFPSALYGADDDALIQCSKITSATERLDCYDQYVKNNLLKTTAKAQIAPVVPTPSKPAQTAKTSLADQEKLIEAEVEKRVEARLQEKKQVEQKKEAEKKLERFGKSISASTPDQIQSTIKAIKQTARRRKVFLLSNGQIWEHTEGSPLSSLKKGASVTIQKGIFGSYKLTVDGYGGSIKVKRKK